MFSGGITNTGRKWRPKFHVVVAMRQLKLTLLNRFVPLQHKLLRGEFEALTYRVLAYLLLGIVRIYSKKVEYLYEDFNEVLVQIKDFVVKKKYKAQLDIPSASYFSITLPERFELDAFDLEILEDANEKNVRSQEEITLKDVEWDSQGSGQFYMDKYHSEDFGVSCSTFPIDLSNEEEILVSNEGMMAGSLQNRTSKEANSCENDGRFSPEEHVNLHGEDEAEPPGPCEPCGEDRTNAEPISYLFCELPLALPHDVILCLLKR